MKSAIFFDLDGTLTDPWEGITRSIAYALERLGQAPPRETDLTWCIGPPLFQSFGRLLSSRDENLIQSAITAYRERYGAVGMYENRVYPEIPEVLTRLRDAGHPLFVATAKPTRFAADILDHFALAPYFRDVYGGEHNNGQTHKEALLAHLLRTEGLGASEGLMIGDREHDIIGARRNGIRSVGVLYGYGSREELSKAGADHLLSRPDQIPEAVSFLTTAV